MLSPNVIIPYDYTHSSIPNGFTRETSLDGRYVKGWGATTPPGTQGGAATHTHTSAAHNHAPTAHQHSVVLSPRIGNPDGIGSSSDGATGNKWYHYHTGLSTTTTGGTNETPTWGSASNDPPFYSVIFIKANSYQLIPKYGIVYRTSLTRPGMTIHTPSIGKYHKGAATLADSGATGGSFTNTHDITHTHAAYHSHTGRTTNNEGDRARSSGNTGTAAPDSHQHDFNLFNATTNLPASATNTSTSNSELLTNVEPVYQTLNAYYSSTSASVPMKGDMCLWLGSTATIPLGWKLCDGTKSTVDMRDKFCKVPTSAPVAPTTGGRNTHAHIGLAHLHSGGTTSHTHGGDDVYNGESVTVGAGSNGYRQFPGHKHDNPGPTIQSVSVNNVTFGTATYTPNASDNQPPYTTIAYLEFMYSAVGGSFIYNLL